MLPAGVEWDRRLDEHLRASSITVVLVSDHTPTAYYQREEIAGAIHLARTQPDRHRVIPVFLGSGDGVPYGLLIRNGIRLSDVVGIDELADRLLSSLEDLHYTAALGPREAATEALQVLEALDAVSRSGPREGSRALDTSIAAVLATALQEAGAPQQDAARFARAVRRTLRAAGIDPRILLGGSPDHEATVKRWRESSPDGDPDPSPFLSAMRAALADGLEKGVVYGVSADTRRLLATVLSAADANSVGSALTRTFRSALFARLQSAHSTSREVSLVAPGVAAAIGSPRSPARSYVAAEMCRLPPRDRYVVGRENLVAALTGGVIAAMAERDVATVALAGQPGMGASTVAVAVARALAPKVPGPVLYVDLKGLDAVSRRSPRTVVRLLSEALGIDTTNTISDEELFAVYREGLEGSHLVLVLDNALDAAHVRGLVEQTASCAVIVTSRNRLQDYADAGLAMSVPPLPRDASVDLLRALAPSGGGSAIAFDRIAQLCDDVPLALRLLGARMAARPEASSQSTSPTYSKTT